MHRQFRSARGITHRQGDGPKKFILSHLFTSTNQSTDQAQGKPQKQAQVPNSITVRNGRPVQKATPNNKSTFPTISDLALSQHWETEKPDQVLFDKAEKVFKRQSAAKRWSATEFHTVPTAASAVVPPEVAFLGRSNVGKSSLLKVLFTHHQNVPKVSANAGCTKAMVAYGVGGRYGNVTILDMPGYGYRGRLEWGTEVMKYLKQRKELRRVFVLVDAKHGMKETDRSCIAMLRQNAIPHQIVLSKVDRVLFPQGKYDKAPQLKDLYTIMEQVRSEAKSNGLGPGPPPLDEMWSCAADIKVDNKPKSLGIKGIRVAILRAIGMDNHSLEQSLRDRVRDKARKVQGRQASPTSSSDELSTELHKNPSFLKVLGQESSQSERYPCILTTAPEAHRAQIQPMRPTTPVIKWTPASSGAGANSRIHPRLPPLRAEEPMRAQVSVPKDIYTVDTEERSVRIRRFFGKGLPGSETPMLKKVYRVPNFVKRRKAREALLDRIGRRESRRLSPRRISIARFTARESPYPRRVSMTRFIVREKSEEERRRTKDSEPKVIKDSRSDWTDGLGPEWADGLEPGMMHFTPRGQLKNSAEQHHQTAQSVNSQRIDQNYGALLDAVATMGFDRRLQKTRAQMIARDHDVSAAGSSKIEVAHSALLEGTKTKETKYLKPTLCDQQGGTERYTSGGKYQKSQKVRSLKANLADDPYMKAFSKTHLPPQDPLERIKVSKSVRVLTGRLYKDAYSHRFKEMGFLSKKSAPSPTTTKGDSHKTVIDDEFSERFKQMGFAPNQLVPLSKKKRRKLQKTVVVDDVYLEKFRQVGL
ncbi:MAG: hypothetical protein M1814_004264 [Vezdaea aestivalis]|nr:MAG: hypothetical protein M1814_004264 [Vezdaea aestivalis]